MRRDISLVINFAYANAISKYFSESFFFHPMWLPYFLSSYPISWPHLLPSIDEVSPKFQCVTMLQASARSCLFHVLCLSSCRDTYVFFVDFWEVVSKIDNSEVYTGDVEWKGKNGNGRGVSRIHVVVSSFGPHKHPIRSMSRQLSMVTPQLGNTMIRSGHWWLKNVLLRANEERLLPSISICAFLYRCSLSSLPSLLVWESKHEDVMTTF